MWGVRRQVNLLLDHGHPEARRYPVGVVWDESSLVVERLNGLETTRAIFVQLAVSSVLSAKAGKNFDKMVKRYSRPTGPAENSEEPDLLPSLPSRPEGLK